MSARTLARWLQLDEFHDRPSAAVAAPATAPDSTPENASESAPEPPVEPAPTQADLDAAEARGHARGWREAVAAQDADREGCLRAIAAKLQDADRCAGAAAEELATAGLRLVLATVLASFPSLAARCGDREIADLLAAVLPAMARQPGVVIRVHPDHVATVERDVARLSHGAAAAPAVRGCESTAHGDATITWQDGRAFRAAADAREAARRILSALGLGDVEPGDERGDDSRNQAR